MRVHCDACGAEIAKEEALVGELEDGEVLYFCSQDCAARKDFHLTYRDPSPHEEATAPDDR